MQLLIHLRLPIVKTEAVAVLGGIDTFTLLSFLMVLKFPPHQETCPPNFWFHLDFISDKNSHRNL